jgi:hypothetical protein
MLLKQERNNESVMFARNSESTRRRYVTIPENPEDPPFFEEEYLA